MIPQYRRPEQLKPTHPYSPKITTDENSASPTLHWRSNLRERNDNKPPVNPQRAHDYMIHSHHARHTYHPTHHLITNINANNIHLRSPKALRTVRSNHKLKLQRQLRRHSTTHPPHVIQPQDRIHSHDTITDMNTNPEQTNTKKIHLPEATVRHKPGYRPPHPKMDPPYRRNMRLEARTRIG
jgi:ribonuclease BN (tRNA processing enzyme)